MTTDITLSDSTQVRIDRGQVEILRSAQRQQGEKMTVEALAQWRGWKTQAEQVAEHARTLAERIHQWLTM